MNSVIVQARAIAEGRKITLLSAAKVLKARIMAKAKEIRRFGTLPDQYDPSKDECHPSKGWKPS